MCIRDRGVGVDGIYHADAAHIDHRVTAKFRVIDNQHNVARVLNNGALGANFVVIELQDVYKRQVQIQTHKKTSSLALERFLADLITINYEAQKK